MNMGDAVGLHHDLAWYHVDNEQNNENAADTDNNWLRSGKAAAAKAPTSQQAHALSMVANLAIADDVEQLVIG